MNGDKGTTKERLREEYSCIRNSMTIENLSQASAAICQHIERWELFQDSRKILTYLPMRGEVDLTALLISHPQKGWLVPRICPKGKMAFHKYDPSRLVRHAFGMLEPSSDLPEAPPHEIQLVFVPGLAFDKQGWRLGYGGGYYDRFLSVYSGISAGLTYLELLMDEIPHDTNDIAVDFVIIETGIESKLI